ncbi:FitA-like ribbon-helix-helix domain-containing protein [Haloferula sp. A504]|uniref:FitA-like ribbon-helix-helix domain-containing protein n=1 Tax=Haloferula sp. A504 TaxID=3373601 RepID=UPI0031BDB617|nr:Arc family DNA-binding protein [Verrucomicrobiaceae bacterium E54]
MKSLHIREVPEETVERLKRRAARHHRSLQGELLTLLEEAAREVIEPEPDEFALLTVKAGGRQNWTREAIYED